MYKVLEFGEEYELFDEGIIVSIQKTIENEIKLFLESNKNPEPSFLGCFAIHNVPLKNGENKNIWIEYNANILLGGLIDCGIHECIVYDKIPDVVLDRYSYIKEIILNNQN